MNPNDKTRHKIYKNSTEVYRLTKFDTNTCYEFALKTRTVGTWPNEKHYTTNKLRSIPDSKREEYEDFVSEAEERFPQHLRCKRNLLGKIPMFR